MDRTANQWLDTIAEDTALIIAQIEEMMTYDGDRVMAFAVARKEAARLHRDIERFAQESYGITRAQLDEIRL